LWAWWLSNKYMH